MPFGLEEHRSRRVNLIEEVRMKDLSFGLTMTLAGMGVTLASLYLLTLVIQLLNRLFPEIDKKEQKK